MIKSLLIAIILGLIFCGVSFAEEAIDEGVKEKKLIQRLSESECMAMSTEIENEFNKGNYCEKDDDCKFCS